MNGLKKAKIMRWMMKTVKCKATLVNSVKLRLPLCKYSKVIGIELRLPKYKGVRDGIL
jgi:hypothetical protein